MSGRQQIDPRQAAPLIIATAVCLVVGGIWAVANLARVLFDPAAALPSNPFAVTLGLATGQVPWPDRSAWAAGILAVPAVVLLVLAVVAARRRGKRRTRVDHLARQMGTGRDLAALSTRGAEATAKNIGLTDTAPGGAIGPGLPIAVTVAGGQKLWQDWESVGVQLWGPRQGKTSTQSIARILAAPGAVVATTNKAGRNEVTAATREHRATKGAVWVFDPQGIAGEAPAFYWDPLSYIREETRDKVGKSRALAKIFTVAQREPGAKVDAYFDPAGQNLVANVLLWAAVTPGRTLLDVYAVLTNFTDVTPIQGLEDAGYKLQAAAVRSVIGMDIEQKGGIYGTAEQTMAFLTSETLPAWITLPAGAFDVQFDPAAFVRSTDTLYLLSKEGEGSTGPLITALTVAVAEAAVAYARTCPRGRLPRPMVIELDEAANICRWADLPDLYSHFGSQGIVVTTYLQSYAQGEAVWGREGMRKLWTAANVAVVGPGVREVGFLTDVSKIIGDYDVSRTSTGHSHRGGYSTNYSTERRAILPVSQLANLPKGRLVVLAAGMPPALCRPVPWWETEHKAIVETSQTLHDPSAPAPPPALPDPVAATRDVPAAGENNPWTDKEWA
jgi:type IV secretory pathway TraG/TraD family ATPase VirD4